MGSSYAKLGQFLNRAGRPFLKLYVSPKMIRVRVLVINEFGEALLVRNWFGHQGWSLPGGGVHYKETNAHAGVRELQEETGLQVNVNDLTDLGSFLNPDPVLPYTVNCQVVTVKKQNLVLSGAMRFEMLDLAWKPLSNLPETRSPVIDKAIKLWQAKTQTTKKVKKK